MSWDAKVEEAGLKGDLELVTVTGHLGNLGEDVMPRRRPFGAAAQPIALSRALYSAGQRTQSA